MREFMKAFTALSSRWTVAIAAPLLLSACVAGRQALEGHVGATFKQPPAEAAQVVESFLASKGLAYARKDVIDGPPGAVEYESKDFEGDLGVDWTFAGDYANRFVSVWVYPGTERGDQVRLSVTYRKAVGLSRYGGIEFRTYHHHAAEKALMEELAKALHADHVEMDDE